MHNSSQAFLQQMQRLSGSAARVWIPKDTSTGWQPISSAPFGCDVAQQCVNPMELEDQADAQCRA